MAIHNALGKAGEDAVAAYLEHNGYVIRDRNWRKNRLELDIVATKDNGLIIVEVKTRSNTEYIKPQDAVNWQKIRRIVIAADAYVKHFRIDVPRALRHHYSGGRCRCFRDRAHQRSILPACVLKEP